MESNSGSRISARTLLSLAGELRDDSAAYEALAERIRLHVAGSPFRVMGGAELLTVTISIGVAATLGETDRPEVLLKRADEAVYEAKASGRNKVVARAA